MKVDFVGTLCERIASKSFVFSFTLVTILCIVDIVIFGLANQYGVNLPYGSVLSYGAIIVLYSICVIECLGLSLLVKLSRVAVAYCENLIQH